MTPRNLIALAHKRQLVVHASADAVAKAVDGPLLEVWRAILSLLERNPGWTIAEVEARRLFQSLVPRLVRSVATDLHAFADWSARSATDDALRGLPLETLRRAARLRLLNRGTLEREERDSDITLSLLREVLFPAPTPEEVHRVIYAHNWATRIANCTRLAAPDQLASILAAGIAAGKDHREIARQIAPLVQGVRSSAKRIARTEALSVAGAMQHKMHEQLGDLVIGYQVHSAHFPDSRSWHVKRSGTCYYKNPQSGQKGMEQCPHPPHEAADPNERPAGTPAVAYNCVCFLTPILRS